MTNATDELLARDAIAAIKAEARKTGIPPKLIHRHGSTDPKAREARCRVARDLQGRGYHNWQIAKALGVGDCTLNLLLKGKTTKPKHLR